MNDKETKTFAEIVQGYEYQILELHQQFQAKQREINWLMLAFCPEKMTKEQFMNLHPPTKSCNNSKQSWEIS